MASITAEPTLRPWRRYLRLSSRGLIVVVLIIGGCLGWLVRGARIQRDAVAAIERGGGHVEYDWEWNDGGKIAGGVPRAPRWLVERIGVNYFGHVTSDTYSPASRALNSDVQFAEIHRFTRLQRLVSPGGQTYWQIGLTPWKRLRSSQSGLA